MASASVASRERNGCGIEEKSRCRPFLSYDEEYIEAAAPSVESLRFALTPRSMEQETMFIPEPRVTRTSWIGVSLVWCAMGHYSAPPLAAGDAVEVTRKADSVTIANDCVRMEISTRGGFMRTTRIENRRAGRPLDLDGDDFILELMGGKVVRSSELSVKGVVEEAVAPAGKSVAVQLEGEGLQVRCVSAMESGQWWASRWLEIRGGPAKLSRVHLARWRCEGAVGPVGQGETVATLGYPSGCGQVVYAGDLFFAITHPGAENFAVEGGVSCSIPAYESLSPAGYIATKKLVVGAGEAGDAWRAFIRYIDATRPVPARMLFLVNDWYWKDKSKPVQALEALVEVKQKSGVLVDTFTLDNGWDFDWDEEAKIWGRLNRQRFPGGWDALQAAGRAAKVNISLWFGPIGGYGDRPRRIEFARKMGFEIQGDKLCLCGPRYKEHVVESFSHWAARGMDYIKVDGFWPDCPLADHGHPVGSAGPIAQMDALIEVFAAWRRARPDLLIGYTSGSNPSPFWLQHADFVWRGGRDDSHAGKGTPFDQHSTYIDSVLAAHRNVDLPISAFVTFDIVQDRIRGGGDQVYERGFWWLAGRTSLHHDWYIQASDLTLGQWKTLAGSARWAKKHEKAFRFGRMIGGDPARGEIYGFSAFDGQRGALALRNPSDESRAVEGALAQWLLLPAASRGRALRLDGVYGKTGGLDGSHLGLDPLRIELPALETAIFDVELEPTRSASPR
jgi:hypothetical protein